MRGSAFSAAASETLLSEGKNATAAAVAGLALLWRLVVRARRRRSWNGPVSTLIFPPEPKVPAAGRAR